MDTIIDSNELQEARAEGLDEIVRETRLMAKRAERPATRQALAEIEETLRRVRQDWAQRGLVPAA